MERIEPLRLAARSEAENLGHAVTQLVSYTHTHTVFAGDNIPLLL